MAVPASRYQISRRAYPAELPAIEYDPTDQVRRVQRDGWISVRGQLVRVPKAFVGQPLALRPTQTDGRVDLVFITHRVGQIDLTQPTLRVQPVTHVSEHL
ncbi:hypothetical protein [Methylobacterium nodulans]|uniref:hypothetical protein n=1 Tax=Methylobacterium nodulans TaxID=114616 RepID=UPI0001618996|nr:hypothetical protein [Methylobacterium nodulans]